jgi:hypothetical protein
MPAAEERAAEERAAEECRRKIELRILTDRAIKEYRASIIVNSDPVALEGVIVDLDDTVDPYTPNNYKFLEALVDYYEICDDRLFSKMSKEFSMLTMMEKVWEFIVLGSKVYAAEERRESDQRKRELKRMYRKDLEDELDLPDALLTANDDGFIDGVIELKKANNPLVASLATNEGIGAFTKMEKLHGFLLG